MIPACLATSKLVAEPKVQAGQKGKTFCSTEKGWMDLVIFCWCVVATLAPTSTTSMVGLLGVYGAAGCAGLPVSLLCREKCLGRQRVIFHTVAAKIHRHQHMVAI